MASTKRAEVHQNREPFFPTLRIAPPRNGESPSPVKHQKLPAQHLRNHFMSTATTAEPITGQHTTNRSTTQPQRCTFRPPRAALFNRRSRRGLSRKLRDRRRISHLGNESTEAAFPRRYPGSATLFDRHRYICRKRRRHFESFWICVFHSLLDGFLQDWLDQRPAFTTSHLRCKNAVRNDFVHLIACHDAVASEHAPHSRFASQRAGGGWFFIGWRRRCVHSKSLSGMIHS